MKNFLIISLVLLISINSLSDVPSDLTPSQTLNQFVNEPNQTVSQAKQLTYVGPRAGEGYYSADGKWMIFQSEREPGNPFFQMYVMNLKTGDTQRVSTGVGKTTCGWIHASNKKVLFSSTHLDKDFKNKVSQEYESRNKSVKSRYSWSYDETFDIFSTDMKGKNLVRLTREKGYDAEGSYSPDGRWIAFASNRTAYTEKLSDEDQKIFDKDASYMMDIYIMREDGTQVKRLTNAKGYDGGPFFSADGKKITWRRFSPNGQTAEIYTMNVDGSDQKQITGLGSMSWAPFYHPSGDYIIFASSVLGYSNFELFIIDSEGKHLPVRVTFSDGFDGLAAFSPDGNKLTWTHRSEKGDSQIMVADWDDVAARKLLGLPINKILASELSSEINKMDLKKWVYYLSQESFRGRPTGSEEEKKYTQNISEIFQALKLKPAGDKNSYIQKFEFTSGVELGINNSAEFVGSFKEKLAVSDKYIPYSFSKTGEIKETPLVFAGYGLRAPATSQIKEYNSYKDIDVKGKWVIVLNDVPLNVSPEKRQHFNMYAQPRYKISVAKSYGAAGVLFVNAPTLGVKDHFKKIKFEGSFTENSLPVLKVSQESISQLFLVNQKEFKQIVEGLDSGEFVAGFDLPSTYFKAQVDLKLHKSNGLNVIGKLEVPQAQGSIVLGAHGDHLGMGDHGNSLAIANEQGHAHVGADDNASGVASVLELAKHYSNNKSKLKKNLYFAIWSGEEVGVLGSNYFIKNWKGEKINANINLDMVGRLKDQLAIQGVGSSTGWSSMIEKISRKSNIAITIQEDPYLPTDSISFYLNDIPAINLFTGAHAEYHTPRDRYELINFEGLYDITGLVAHLTDEVSNGGKNSLPYVKIKKEITPTSGRSFRIFLGTIPDYMQEGVKGVRISGVSKDSPAEIAGLRAKDIIIQFNKTKIENLYDYVFALQSVRPNTETDIQVLRDGQAHSLKVTPRIKE